MEEEPRLMVDPSFNSLDGLGERFPPMARVRARFQIPASALASSLWIMMGPWWHRSPLCCRRCGHCGSAC